MKRVPSTEIVVNHSPSSEQTGWFRSQQKHRCSADAGCCQHANAQHVGLLTARAQELAARLLVSLESTLGERGFSLRLLLVCFLSTLCVLSAAYLEMLLTTGARAELFTKYGAVFASTLAGLAITAVRGRNVGLLAFALVVLASCALDRSQLQAYLILLVLAIPGLVFGPPLMIATRWMLRRACTSSFAAAWLGAVIAGPFVSFYGTEPSLLAFFTKLSLAAATSCNLLLSVGLLAYLAWSGLRVVLAGTLRAHERSAEGL
jgi:hypothetical protein